MYNYRYYFKVCFLLGSNFIYAAIMKSEFSVYMPLSICSVLAITGTAPELAEMLLSFMRSPSLLALIITLSLLWLVRALSNF